MERKARETPVLPPRLELKRRIRAGRIMIGSSQLLNELEDDLMSDDESGVAEEKERTARRKELLAKKQWIRRKQSEESKKCPDFNIVKDIAPDPCFDGSSSLTFSTISTSRLSSSLVGKSKEVGISGDQQECENRSELSNVSNHTAASFQASPSSSYGSSKLNSFATENSILGRTFVVTKADQQTGFGSVQALEKSDRDGNLRLCDEIVLLEEKKRSDRRAELLEKKRLIRKRQSEESKKYPDFNIVTDRPPPPCFDVSLSSTFDITLASLSNLTSTVAKKSEVEKDLVVPLSQAESDKRSHLSTVRATALDSCFGVASASSPNATSATVSGPDSPASEKLEAENDIIATGGIQLESNEGSEFNTAQVVTPASDSDNCSLSTEGKSKVEGDFVVADRRQQENMKCPAPNAMKDLTRDLRFDVSSMLSFNPISASSFKTNTSIAENLESDKNFFATSTSQQDSSILKNFRSKRDRLLTALNVGENSSFVGGARRSTLLSFRTPQRCIRSTANRQKNALHPITELKADFSLSSILKPSAALEGIAAYESSPSLSQSGLNSKKGEGNSFVKSRGGLSSVDFDSAPVEMSDETRDAQLGAAFDESSISSLERSVNRLSTEDNFGCGLNDSVVTISTPGLEARLASKRARFDLLFASPANRTIESSSMDFSAVSSMPIEPADIENKPIHLVSHYKKVKKPELMLAKRKILHTTDNSVNGLRRSTRNRVTRLRHWLGEEAVYELDNEGNRVLVDVTSPKVNDPFLLRHRSATMKDALEEQKRRQQYAKVLKRKKQERQCYQEATDWE